MKINTQFNVGQNLWLIDYDKIVSYPVDHITAYVNKHGESITYHFCTSKAATNMDKDKYIERNESQVFKDLDDMVDSVKYPPNDQ